MFCNGPLDWDQNGLTWSISLSAYDPDYAAHDLCAEAARGNQRDLSMHKLYCHLEGCEWQSRRWEPRKQDRPEIAPEPLPPNVGD